MFLKAHSIAIWVDRVVEPEFVGEALRGVHNSRLLELLREEDI